MKMMTLMPDDDGTTVFVKIRYFSCHRRKCEINNTNISIHHQHQYYHHPHLHYRHGKVRDVMLLIKKKSFQM